MPSKRNIPILIFIFLVILCFEAEPISITKSQPLGFGSLVPGDTSGSLTVSSNGSISSSNLDYVQGNVQVAICNVTGEIGEAYNIFLPDDNTVELTDGSGHSMYVNDFTSDPSGSGDLGTDGKQTLQVGGTLEVGSSQSTGSYQGSFTVEVVHQ